MSRLAAICLGMVAIIGVNLGHAEYLTTATHDILSAFSRAALDLPVPRDYLATLSDLNLTSNHIHALTLADSRPRRKRQLMLKNKEHIIIEVEARFVMPLFQIYEGDNINFEAPFIFEMELPDLLQKRADGKKASEIWGEAVGAMASDMEGLISMLGIDGGGCVRRALCELATMPPLHPEGLVGEMLEIIVRRMTNDSDLSHAVLDTLKAYEQVGTIEGEEEEETTTVATEEEEEKKKEGEKKGEELKKKQSVKETKLRQRRDKLNYLEASDHGKFDGDCATAFPECPYSIIDMFSSSS